MVSEQFKIFRAAMEASMASSAPATLRETRRRIDATMGALPLADGISAQAVDADGVASIVCRPDGNPDHPSVLYFHGGAYRVGSATSYRPYGSYLAQVCVANVILVDYRLAPENPFPGAVEDAIRAYRWVVKLLGGGERVVVGGDSAGGGLVGALLLAAKAQGLALPAGAFMLSPWADLTNQADSFLSRVDTDKLFSKTSAQEAARLYLQDADPTNPLASPLRGDWSGLPPILVQASDAEVLVDDAKGIAAAIRQAGGDVDLQLVDDMPHVWQLHYPAYPEAIEAVQQIAAFVRRVTSAG